MKRSVGTPGLPALLVATVLVFGVPASKPAIAQTDLNNTLEQFDDIRALAMRGMLRAQELKTASLYGRGFGLDVPERIPEDMLVEGLWLFDYLNMMDYQAMSLVSYAAAAEHPNLEQELDAFKAFMPVAARETIAYYDMTSNALAQAVTRVNAAAVKQAPFNLQTIPPRPWTNDPTQAIAGDGFVLGWSWDMLPGESSKVGRYFKQHGYSPERVFKLATKAGINFIRPMDRGLFDWSAVEKEEGKYDWSRIDKLLALYKKYNMAIWLPVQSHGTGPPAWLSQRLGNSAVLLDGNGRPFKNKPMNLFNPEVNRRFAAYLGAAVARVKQSGVKIVAVELGSLNPHAVLPSYAGPEAQGRWQGWLEKNKIDPRKRWNKDIDPREAILPEQVGASAATDPETEHFEMKMPPAPGKVTVDGKTDDWDLTGGMFICNSPEKQRDTLGCWLHLMYDKNNLYINARWLDETPLNHTNSLEDGKGWEGDCLQVRMISAFGSPQERVAHLTCWQGRNGKDVVDVSYGRDFKAGAIADAQAAGGNQEFRVRPDGKGYSQEISLPWKLITTDGNPPKANDALRLTAQLSLTGSRGERVGFKDVFAPGVDLDRFYTFREVKLWGTAVVSPKGDLTPQPVRLRDGRRFPVTMDGGLPKVDWSRLVESKAQMLTDLASWREDEFIEYFRAQVAAVRKVAPEVPICTQSCDSHERNQSLDGRPDERLIRELGLTSYAYANGVSTWDDLRRSYSSAHWSATSTHTGSGNAFSQYAFSSVIHGTLTVMSGPTPIARAFYWGDCFMYPDFRWRWSSLGGWRRFHERAQGMGPEMLSTRPTPQVALMWSDTSNKYQGCVTDYVGGSYGFSKQGANYNKIGCLGWGRILNSVCLAHDFVTEEQVRRGKLKQYPMLIMPAVQALPADVAQKIREYVRDGGIVIATSAPALYDGNMQQKGAGQLADVFGADFNGFIGKTVIAESPMGTPNQNEALYEYWNGPNKAKAEAEADSSRTVYCTFRPRKGAIVAEKFSAGREPAVIINSFGKGKAVVIGYPFGREAFLSDTYHMHYGHNWADWPYGSIFQQGLCRWLELLLPKIGLEREAVVSEEIVPRAVGQDAGWPVHQWTRKGGGYRDYVWKTGLAPGTTASPDHGNAAPRSVELAFRRREGNPNTYLSIFNREGAYGHDPGVVHFEATSKNIKIELPRRDIRRIYDLSLGCAVPFNDKETTQGAGKPVTTFRTMIEPAMARMLVIATQDDTIRIYSGNRQHGRNDEEIRETVGKLATAGDPPEHIVFAPADITGFFAQRAPGGMTISAESPSYLPPARRLAAAIEKAYGGKVRITRNSPRIRGSHKGLGVWRAEDHELVEAPDILLGSHNESHYICLQRMAPGREGHSAPLPIICSNTFPGPGRSAVTLLRPYKKRRANGKEIQQGRIFGEDPAPTSLVIGASDVNGLEAGVDNVIKLFESKPAE